MVKMVINVAMDIMVGRIIIVVMVVMVIMVVIALRTDRTIRIT